MNILNKLRSAGAFFGLCLAVSLFGSRPASAEMTLFDQDGWTFTFDGRVDAFVSGGKGDDMPNPTPGVSDPNNPGHSHIVMGSNSPQPARGVGDVGWLSSYQQSASDKYLAVRVRSGYYPNILGFGIQRKVNDQVVVKGYVSIWSTVETLGRDKWSVIDAEAREGYFSAIGPWGTFTAGRMLGWLGRTSYEIDSRYGHTYGLGLPCTDALGPGCGHIGTGELFPGYSAGASYSTPSIGGLQVHAGIYDPVVLFNANAGMSPNDWSRASFVRPEGSVTYDRPLAGSGRLKIGVEGLVQQVTRTGLDASGNPKNINGTVWGLSGGARVEVGPLRLGGSGFRGQGIGLGYALQRSLAISDNDSASAAPSGLTYGLRTFTGYYGQAAFVRGPWQLSAGYGQGIVDQLAIDKVNPNLSVIHTQTGISAAIYLAVTDSIVVGLDYFHYRASWYGAPIVDGTGASTGTKLAGELQNLDFLNLGVTYHW